MRPNDHPRWERILNTYLAIRDEGASSDERRSRSNICLADACQRIEELELKHSAQAAEIERLKGQRDSYQRVGIRTMAQRDELSAHADCLLTVIEDMAGQGCSLSDLIGTDSYQEFRGLVQRSVAQARGGTT